MESEQKIEEPEKFFLRETFETNPDIPDNLWGIWQRISQFHYPKDSTASLQDGRFFDVKTFGIKSQDINSKHGVDFLNNVIPEIIQRVRATANKRKIRILDSGCGLAFAADQIRTKFCDDVKVFGTSLSKNPRAANAKRNIINHLRDNTFIPKNISMPIKINHETRAQILASLGREMCTPKNERTMFHSDDAKWRSILELTDYPEFDLIIDTFGEIYYTDDVSYEPDDFLLNFHKVIHAAIRKLMPGGQIYIAGLLKEHEYDYLKKNKKKLHRQYGITIEWKQTLAEESTHVYKGIVITKAI